MRTITHDAAPVIPSRGRIEMGVIYVDLREYRTSNEHQWFIGSGVYRDGCSEIVPALVCLRTGDIFRYANGRLPGEMCKAAPGTITIDVP